MGFEWELMQCEWDVVDIEPMGFFHGILIFIYPLVNKHSY